MLQSWERGYFIRISSSTKNMATPNGNQPDAAKFELPTERPPNPEEVARYIKAHPELERPLWFPNHQGKFIAFTWFTCAVMTFYYVFWHEFPQEEHCFSAIRRYAANWKRKLFTVGEDDDEVIQKRIQELKLKIEAKKLLENGDNANN